MIAKAAFRQPFAFEPPI